MYILKHAFRKTNKQTKKQKKEPNLEETVNRGKPLLALIFSTH